MHFAIFHLRVQVIGHTTHCRQLSNIWIASRFEMCSHRSHTCVHKHKHENNGVDGRAQTSWGKTANACPPCKVRQSH